LYTGRILRFSSPPPPSSAKERRDLARFSSLSPDSCLTHVFSRAALTSSRGEEELFAVFAAVEASPSSPDRAVVADCRNDVAMLPLVEEFLAVAVAAVETAGCDRTKADATARAPRDRRW
jgi:hypothetical protein